MALTPEQKARRIELLEEQRKIILSGAKPAKPAEVAPIAPKVSDEPAPVFGGGITGARRAGMEVVGGTGATGDFAKKSIFPKFTPKEQLERPLLAATAKTGKEIVSVPANFFNQLLLNAPRSLVEGAGFEFPSEVEAPLPKAIGKAAGVVGAVKSPIIKAASGIARGLRIPKIAKGAVEGAIIGGAVSPEEFGDVKQRAVQAAGGAVVGAGLSAISAGAVGTRGLFRKGIQKIRQAKAGKLAGDDIVQLRREIQDANTALKSTVETTKTKARALQKRLAAERTILEDQIEKDVATKAGELSIKTQKASREFIKGNSKKYGERLDVIDESLTPDQQAAFTVDNITNLVEQATDDAAEALITEGAGINALNKIADAFVSSPGKIGLKKLLNIVRSAKQSISAGAKAGREGFTADDIPIEMFRKNVGLFLESIGVDDIAQLNKEYVPVMELTKKINATFKPFKGALDSGKGQALFSRVLGGKAQKLEETELLRRVKTGEKGFAKGIGDIDKVAKAAIKSLKDRVSQIEARGQKVSQAEKTKIVSETRKIAEAVSQKKLDIRKLQDIVRAGKDATGILKKAGLTVTALSATGLLGLVTKKIATAFGRSKK